MYGLGWWYCKMSLVVFGKLLLPAFIIIFVVTMVIMYFLPEDTELYELMPLIIFVAICLAIVFLPFVIICGVIWLLIMVVADY